MYCSVCVRLNTPIDACKARMQAKMHQICRQVGRIPEQFNTLLNNSIHFSHPLFLSLSHTHSCAPATCHSSATNLSCFSPLFCVTLSLSLSLSLSHTHTHIHNMRAQLCTRKLPLVLDEFFLLFSSIMRYEAALETLLSRLCALLLQLVELRGSAAAYVASHVT